MEQPILAFIEKLKRQSAVLAERGTNLLFSATLLAALAFRSMSQTKIGVWATAGNV
jgi:hypothetical protein